jgi:hypothetical protein
VILDMGCGIYTFRQRHVRKSEENGVHSICEIVELYRTGWHGHTWKPHNCLAVKFLETTSREGTEHLEIEQI